MPERRPRSRSSLLFLLVSAAGSWAGADCDKGSTTFQADTFIIPMDTTYQDSGMLVAFSLVHELLKAGVPVDWAIMTGKSFGDVDFTGPLVTDVRISAVIVDPEYRGGPFVVDAAYHAQALPIVTQALAAHPALAVHLAEGSFVADIGRALLTAPTIAVFADGNEDIAFKYMNAAAVPQDLRTPSRPGNRVVAGAPSTAPAVTAAPAGNNVVLGTSATPAGSVVQVFINQRFAGTTTVQAGGTWSLGPVAIPPGINVTAAVTAGGSGTSNLSGNRASGALAAGGSSAAPVITAPLREGDGVVAGTSSEANGTIVKVFRDGLLFGTTTVTGGRWSLPLVGAVAGGDTWNATATAPSKTESALSTFVIAVPVPPVVTPSVVDNDTNVPGIYKMADQSPVHVYRTRGGVDTLIASANANNLTFTAAPPASAIDPGDEIWARTGRFPWPDAKEASYACPGRGCCPECLNESDIIGTTGNVQDGRLFDPAGQPRFCQLMSMHYGVGEAQLPDVAEEVRSFLGYATHAFFECQAVNAFENTEHLLTTAGLDDEDPTDQAFFFFGQDSPFAQAHGTYENVGGSERAYSLKPGSAYHNANVVHVSDVDVPGHGERDIWMTGQIDGDPAKGKVSYLGGHEYKTDMPMSAHPDSQGTRYFLNSLYEAPCVCNSANVAVVKSGPPITTSDIVTYSIAYTNTGSTFATNVRIFDAIPSGSTFVSATNNGVFLAGVVTWNIGTLQPGASGSVQVTVQLGTFGSYTDVATASWSSGQLNQTSAPSSVTTQYCDAAIGLPEVDPPPMTGLRSVKVAGTNDLRITWTDSLPSIPCASTYRVYGAVGATCPTDLTPYTLLGSTTQPTFDHAGALVDGQTWWYLVVTSDGVREGKYDTYYGYR